MFRLLTLRALPFSERSKAAMLSWQILNRFWPYRFRILQADSRNLKLKIREDDVAKRELLATGRLAIARSKAILYEMRESWAGRLEMTKLDALSIARALHRTGTVRDFGQAVSLHANVSLPARARRQLERLCRYVARPAIATERLSLLLDGRVMYELRHRWHDGTTDVVLE